MSNVLFNYIFILSLAGFIVLIFLSILAFTDNESLRIEKGKHINSGVMLLINGFIYLGISIFAKYKILTMNKRKGYM